MKLTATVLDAPDPRALARFYRDLLGWPLVHDEPDWATLRPTDGGPGLSFQAEPRHVRPVWPTTTDHPGMQLHLDIEVDDLDAACDLARSLGARPATHQFQDDVRVWLDPAGHPFCLWIRT
ncbi:VOC family protein [Actinosynnema sp. NPDC020468]|uniref:VOC family protein n=1 Tax=Actinosynnema sp. NPDC020468 TaxID=3154488 RepID=UPI0033EFAF0F